MMRKIYQCLIIAITIIFTVVSLITCYTAQSDSADVKHIYIQRLERGIEVSPDINSKPIYENSVEEENTIPNDDKQVKKEDVVTWEPSGEYAEIDRLILINKSNPVDRNFVPEDLVQVMYCAADRSASGQKMTREAADAFNKLAEDALVVGHEIVVTTAYRSYDFQSYLYNGYVEKDGKEAADRYSAQPGKSEHQSGLSADVSSPVVDYKLTAQFGQTEAGKWLAQNCYKYGFIIRFPDGKENITGYTYEPWHIRYVGVDAAEYIYKDGITLEEYLK